MTNSLLSIRFIILLFGISFLQCFSIGNDSITSRRREVVYVPTMAFLTSFSSKGRLRRRQEQQEDERQHKWKLNTNFFPTTSTSKYTSQYPRKSILLNLAKTAAKKNKKKTTRSSSGGSGGLKGFGGGGGGVKGSGSSSNKGGVDIDRSKGAREFYTFMENGNAGDNLNRCALGYFSIPLSDGDTDDTDNVENGNDKKFFKLRGIVAMKPIKTGDDIIRIPYEMAINLGQEGSDPTVPATALLRDYCTVLGNTADDANNKVASYYKMLPPFRGDDCLGSTDFFSNDVLEALQAPLIVEETLKRRERTTLRFQTDIQNDETFPKWIDGTDITAEHLQWAVWLITSRVLTVQGGEEEGKSYRLLIPFLDMCNHDRSSSHVLTGRAIPGGELKVVAGTPVKDGEQVNICYGGGLAGNDRFIQDYGFLDISNDKRAYDMVALQLLGKRRIVEGIGAGRIISESDRMNTMEQLEETSLEEDKKLLREESDTAMQAALNYRIGIKEALTKFS